MSRILYARILVTYRGRFYAVFNGDVFVIDPFSLDATPLILSQPLISQKHLVPSGNDEIFLVERIRSECWSPVRVSKLDEEAGKWVEVSDLGERVLFIGKFGNVSCSAKELPHGCGLSGNSILFTNVPGNVTNPYKYGVHLRRAKCWRLLRKNRVIILNTSPVMVLQHFRSWYWKKNDSRRGLAISTKKTPSNSFSKLDRRSSASKMAERREEADVVLWRWKQDAFRSTFSTKATWNYTRTTSNKVPWHNGVWFTHEIPKYSFCVWLAAHDRLSTGDRMAKWNVGATTSCAFGQHTLEKELSKSSKAEL